MVLIREINGNILITIGDKIINFNPESGEDTVIKIPEPELPPNLTKQQEDVLKNEKRTINSIGLSENKDYFAISTENKQIIVYNSVNLRVIQSFIVPRTASQICFTPSNDILVADKTGDVYLYQLFKTNKILLLGHLSIILDMAISNCGKFIITCDRDEKIRVSQFPNAYNIVSYCLGHREFVVKVKIIGNLLVSASGDGTIRFWDFCRGQQVGIVDTNENMDEKQLLNYFSKEMDSEKVDITALPITDMQVYKKNNCLVISVTLYSYPKIQLYQTDLNDFKTVFVKNFNFDNILSFSLSEKLIVLTNSGLISCDLESGFVQTENFKFNQFYEKHKNILTISNDCSITVLYKRKFDNVQEYLEKKKLRLEAKK